jgi:predicted lactoylglutathione lyase
MGDDASAGLSRACVQAGAALEAISRETMGGDVLAAACLRSRLSTIWLSAARYWLSLDERRCRSRSESMSDIYHRGRLIDHVHLRVADLGASKRFYKAILSTVGREPTYESDEAIGFDELWIDAADKAGPSRVHLAFQAEDQNAVKRFHEAGLKAGGRDNGVPGERSYHPGYYACFQLDPDGHNIEAVFHGPMTRSAASVEVRATR